MISILLANVFLSKEHLVSIYWYETYNKVLVEPTDLLSNVGGLLFFEMIEVITVNGFFIIASFGVRRCDFRVVFKRSLKTLFVKMSYFLFI
jgi:hypothetical protein